VSFATQTRDHLDFLKILRPILRNHGPCVYLSIALLMKQVAFAGYCICYYLISVRLAGRVLQHMIDLDQTIRCVRNCLSDHRRLNEPPLPGADAMQNDYPLFQVQVIDLVRDHRLDNFHVLTHSDFLWDVHSWLKARTEGTRQTRSRKNRRSQNVNS
jgi:hypothetical protein